MANVIKGSNEVKVRRNGPQSNKSKIILILLAFAVFFGYMFIKTNSLVFMILAVASLALTVIVAIVRIDNGSGQNDPNGFVIPDTEQERYGAIGELKTGILLEQLLPEDYTVIQNAIVFYDGKQSEIDNIVIGNTGVYIIEVKTMKGKILADYDGHDWKKIKTDKYGIEHEKEFYSPVKQVDTHVYRLANVLRRSGVNAYVRAIVYFSDPEADVTVSGEENNIPVFDYNSRNKIKDFICNNPPVLTDASVNDAIRILTGNN